MHTTDITNPKRIELAKKVSEVMPEGLRGDCHTSFFQAGSDAVETAIKFSRKHTGRTQIIAFQGAYHGVWCGTSALTTGYNYRHGWGPLIAGVQHLPYAYCYRCPFNMTYPRLRRAVRQVRGLRPQHAVHGRRRRGRGHHRAPAG